MCSTSIRKRKHELHEHGLFIVVLPHRPVLRENRFVLPRRSVLKPVLTGKLFVRRRRAVLRRVLTAYFFTVRLSTLFKLKLNHTIKIFVLYFYTACSGYSPDHMTSWNTPQRITWTSTKAGQTSYPFNSPPEEDIEVEEVPAVSHSGDEPLTDTRRNNSIETLGQEFHDAQIDINNKYIELRDVQDDINSNLTALRSELREAHNETRRALDTLGREARASHLETRSRLDTQDRFIQNAVDQTFRRIQTMRSTLDQEFNRSDRRVTEFHRELVLMFHHLILVITEE